MPKHRKGKGKATAPMAVPALDNRPRYRTPEVQVSVPQSPTPEPTPASKTGNRQVSVERKSGVEMAVSVHAPLVRVPNAIVREALAQVDLRKQVGNVHEEEEEEGACGEISDSDDDYNFSGHWVSKGNPNGFLDSEDEEILDR